jgi:hypothetical protein
MKKKVSGDEQTPISLFEVNPTKSRIGQCETKNAIKAGGKRGGLEAFGTYGNSLVLTFGNESRLRQMSMSHYFSSKQPRAYLLFSVPRLKVIRANLEFVTRKGLSTRPEMEILDE